MGTRDVILDAAADVMRSRGLARSTTKEIARAAGFSEATLYKHFAGKTELLVAVLQERSPGFAALAQALHDRAGRDTVEANLTAVAQAALSFYTANFPMLASIFSEPEILAGHRDGLRRTGAGPHRPVVALAAYLRAEQDHGRVRADADPVAAASLLLGACMQHAFLGLMGWNDRRSDAESAPALAHAVVTSLLP